MSFRMRNKMKLSVFILLFTLSVLFMFVHNFDNTVTRVTGDSDFAESFQKSSHVLFTKGCKVPKFDPFDPTVLKYYRKITGDVPCEGKKYLSLQNNVVVLNKEQVRNDFKGKFLNCTYGNASVLNFNVTLPDEFVKVTCEVDGDSATYEDFFASTPLKPPVEDRCLKHSAKISTQHPLNIIVVGIDSVSKLNFDRHFALTGDYLRKNLSTFEFHGYMKVADNTFPNLTPLLTGHFIDHYYNKSNRLRYFDDLDFIWKNFSSIGYRTLYAEDAPFMGTFNYAKRGFQFPPTDYFFRPFSFAVEDTPWKDASKVDCFQANPEIVVLFNYLRSFLTTMGERPYFAFTWASRLTHGDLNKAGYADKPTYELLKDIHDMGLLNKSVLLFMSDHGIRFGGIRQTFIGKVEERMPFLFASFPKWFLDSHPEIRENLNSNQKRLTTHFDVHEMLVDIFQMTSGDRTYLRTPYGVSLFREISEERNCFSAFIKPHWCVCHEYKNISFSGRIALAAAQSLVKKVNDITEPHRKLCAEVKLDVILDARVSKPEKELLRYKELKSGDDESSITYGHKTHSFEKIMITLRTKPGGAVFESTLRKITDYFKVDDISRINEYGTQSECVNDDFARKFCYCKTNEISDEISPNVRL